MGTAIVTGSGGLVGSESVAFFSEAGFDVVGIENDMRARFFGEDAPAVWKSNRPAKSGDAGAMLATIIERAARLKAAPSATTAAPVKTARSGAVSRKKTVVSRKKTSLRKK